MRNIRTEFLIIFTLGFIIPVLSGLFATPVSAYGVWTTDQTGTLKTTFYNNETVYVTSGNITSTGGANVRVYIVENNDSWVDGQALIDATGMGYKTITTNSSGHLPVTSIWVKPEIGTYDIVADVNVDGEYNSSYDFLNSSTTTGFTVLEAPIPTLYVETGINNPSSHSWNLKNDTGHNPMLQLNFTATIEPVKINSIVITASGSGDDKEDITVVYLILDSNANGQYDRGDIFLGYSDYLSDDGVITFEIDGGQIVPTTGSVSMLITYSMSSSGQVGSTYKFDVILISGVGTATGETANVVGLPIGSAIKTITGATTTTTTSTTTTLVPTDECQTDADCGGVSCANNQKTTYSCKYDNNKGVNVCASTIESVACCGDADCVEGYYCLNYKCVKEESIGGWLSGALNKRNIKLTIISIVVVVALALVAFFIIKNRRSRKPWKSKKAYEKEWENLRKKWGERKQ